MSTPRQFPANPLEFLQGCVREGRLLWTYHVNMRLGARSITRATILGSVDSFEIIEEYPEDKYLPSYLVRAQEGDRIFHVLMAADVPGNNARVVTAYIPDPHRWDETCRKRRQPS